MRALLSTIGSRGDVQPVVALAVELKALGHDVHLVVPPDFRSWIESLGIAVTPIGPELRATGKENASAPPLTPEQRKQLAEGTVRAQFDTIATAAEGCDVMLGATALQVAGPSIAEKLGVPYVFAAFCPAVLPSKLHAPPVLGWLGDKPAAAVPDHTELWDRDAERMNAIWSGLLYPHRERLGLPPISDVRSHIHTASPWLASDSTLGPWPDADRPVFQTGAWILHDERPLAIELERFLDAGEPPIYFGFGSIRAPAQLSAAMIASARALGKRAILSRGWADLALVDDTRDCIAIDEVNQQALFKRVAAVVHHGGAGTTTAAARAGAPQVIVPQMYDQHYWARRAQSLGIGVAHEPGAPTSESLTRALADALQSGMVARAREVATQVRGDGARVAAKRLVDLVG